MSLGDLLPLQFYEIAFVCAFLFVPVVSFRGDFENYFFGVLVLYMLLRVIKNRKKSKLPSDGKAVFISGCDSGMLYICLIISQNILFLSGCLLSVIGHYKSRHEKVHEYADFKKK